MYFTAACEMTGQSFRSAPPASFLVNPKFHPPTGGRVSSLSVPDCICGATVQYRGEERRDCMGRALREGGGVISDAC